MSADFAEIVKVFREEERSCRGGLNVGRDYQTSTSLKMLMKRMKKELVRVGLEEAKKCWE